MCYVFLSLFVVGCAGFACCCLVWCCDVSKSVIIRHT